MSQLIPVSFYEDTVVIIGRNNEPYVAMKPIALNMGLSWDTQFRKINEKFASTIVEMTTVAEDGKTRGMTCLPLRKLPAWLYSISPNKVKPELRDKIIRYQSECDDVLWDYWNKGRSIRISAPTLSQQLAVSRHRTSLLKELHSTRDQALRLALHEQLAHTSRLIGLSVPALESIGAAGPDVTGALAPFWQALDFLESKGERYNHSSKPKSFLALRLDDLQIRLDKHGGPNVYDTDLPNHLKQSRSPRLIEQGRNIRSAISGKTLRCWIFEPR